MYQPLDLSFGILDWNVAIRLLYVKFVYSIRIFYFGVCNWMPLRCLVPSIIYLPSVCWSTFGKSTFKQQLICKFNIAENVLINFHKKTSFRGYYSTDLPGIITESAKWRWVSIDLSLELGQPHVPRKEGRGEHPCACPRDWGTSKPQFWWNCQHSTLVYTPRYLKNVTATVLVIGNLVQI